MSDVRLRPMRWWDVDALLPVEAALFGASAWSAELFWSELAAPGRTYLVAVEKDEDDDGDGALLGYGGLALAGPDADVQTLAVAPRAQRRGVGSLLLDALLDAARGGGASSVLLEVRADNAPAQALYAARGFERIGVRRRYYQPEDVDALVLRRRVRG
ncbi:ribosomal-protein-alanine N-acetyltransferase [Quadrisphaera granulorum]|uniref:Ribosomal-protein-alanine N-acetyltransferase n=1 Tax=Quadrisphaera granulorum TaxID=317664 RepID=A0A316ADS7_9ACTN|nr:ribosomal protein S18-alanine N-acetyltransferase [Quadrisphaera granulorum]PWJ55428.1 ribosomal-protein-alanine N-acetyltransferase [Quadrisphaera granulorum]SZE95492.1 ribosomal-protein-alanine N-acetyltransferase [Quadrisphaera granulorum]